MSPAPRLVPAVVVALAAAVHCGGSTSLAPTSGDGGGGGGVRFPKQHRAVAETCPTTRPPGTTDAGFDYGDAGPPFPDACNSDAECTKGKNGRCLPQRFGAACTYDACFADSDCAPNAACQCSGGGNTCAQGTCRSDAECGGRGCSPTLDFTCGAYGGQRGWYCHTPTDECIDDSDCTEGGSGFCGWEAQSSRWKCSYGGCAG